MNFGAIWQALIAYKEIVGLVLALSVTTLIFWVFWERLSFSLWNLWYGLPLIGKQSKISSQLDRPQNATWYLAEETLCSDYASWIKGGKRSTYENAKKYLAKADDSKSKTTPFMLWVLLAVMVFAEALVFANVLAPVFAGGISRRIRR